MSTAADDVVLVSMFGTEDDLEAEFASWVTERTPQDAARELLTSRRRIRNGPDGGGTAGIQARDPAEPAWREALDRSRRR